MAKRVIIESESGIEIMGGILGSLIYLFIIVPVLFVVDVIKEHSKRGGPK